MTRKTRSIIGAMADMGTEAVEPPAHKRELGLVAARIEALTETGRDAGKQTILLSPSECTIWPGNARDYAAITEESAHELIDAIIAEGGNRVPVTVRRRRDNPEKPYELLVGTRRHWAIAWANANHYPDLKLLAIVENLDDEAAFRLADIENRARTDVTDLERARNYRDAIQLYYGGVQRRMAERLKLSDAYLSRLLALAELPNVVVEAFPNPASVTAKVVQPLIPVLRDPAKQARVVEAAQALSDEQADRRRSGAAVLPAAAVVQQLVTAAADAGRARRGRAERVPALAVGSRVVARVTADRKDVFVFQVEDVSAPVDDIVAAFRAELARSRLLAAKSK